MENKTTDKTYFDSYQLGDITLSNRLVMSAMTRGRADPKDAIANELMAKYYSQRASAGLILTEATGVGQSGRSVMTAPGLWNKEQAAGWKKVVDAVHEKGGKIFVQLWHGGRTANPEQTGVESLAPSAIPTSKYDKEGNETKGPVPKEMTVDDIKEVVEQFRNAAKNAKEAGFDGIELNAANGYLVDQFIRDGTNKRSDNYGSSAENRAKFALEIIDALIEVYGAGRVGIKFSPVGRYEDMFDSNPIETYTYLLNKLSERKIAFVELTEARDFTGKLNYPVGKEQIPEVAKQFRDAFKGTVITNNGHTIETGLQFIQSGIADLVSFGKNFLANPDLPERIKNNWEVSHNFDYPHFFTGGESGYVDYPTYQPKEKVEGQ